MGAGLASVSRIECGAVECLLHVNGGGAKTLRVNELRVRGAEVVYDPAGEISVRFGRGRVGVCGFDVGTGVLDCAASRVGRSG